MNKWLMVALAAFSLSACGDNTAPQNSVGPNAKERSIAFKTIAGDMKILGDVVKGDKPYDAEAFKAQVAELVKHSREPFKHFTQDGAGQNGKARAEVWSNPSAFQAEEDKFLKAVDGLASATESGNIDNIRPAFGAVGGSCKSCHDQFKYK